jgi:hypothetical protein
MFRSWINFLKRPPRVGGRKDTTMSQQHTVSESPGTAVPGNPAPDNAPAPSDVSGQISALTDAVNRLVQAQQQQPARAQQEQPVAPSSTADIGGDLPGGAALLPAVDVARLSPVQQIALGLRDAKPVGPAHPAVLHASGTAPRDGVAPDAPPVGAD